ncbi:MAG: type II secretion system protein [Dehalococcoidia bacterium]|nr:type II secretion system protein [Dehalococcoidia bacterium]
MQMMIRLLSQSQRIRRPVRREKGIALVEVLASIAILGVVAVAFLSALTTAYGAIVVADRHTRAESLTRTVFEHMRNLSYDDCDNPLKAFPDEWETDGTYGYPYGFDGHYKVEVTSHLSTDSSGSTVKAITVSILYRGDTVSTTTTYRTNPNVTF